MVPQHHQGQNQTERVRSVEMFYIIKIIDMFVTFTLLSVNRCSNESFSYFTVKFTDLTILLLKNIKCNL